MNASTIPTAEGDAMSITANACGGLDEAERTQLREAARIMVDERGMVVRITEFMTNAAGGLGRRLGGMGTRVFGFDLGERVRGLAELALWRGYDAATAGLATQGLDAAGRTGSWPRTHKLITVASGAVTGFIGLPGVLVDVPLTTAVILRSVAEIARAHGEDPADLDTKRACIEVLALGGPEIDNQGLETGYWTTRVALNHTMIDTAIRFAAARFGAVLSEKLVAQSLPVLGSLAGAGLNYVFIDYYQQMARVHFLLRALERRHGPDAVRACFGAMLDQARAARQIAFRPAA